MRLEEVKQAIREPYAWPGGYEKVFLATDGEALCMTCAHENFKEIVYAHKYDDFHGGWLMSAVFINWEDTDLYCSHCNERILSECAEED